MLTVRDVMTTDIIALAPHSTLREAVEVLARNHLSGAPVLEGGKVVGTLSASDLLAFEASLPGVPIGHEEPENLFDGRVEEWDDEDTPPAAYYTELWEDAGADVSERFAEIEGPEWDTLSEHIVQEAMSLHVISLPPDAPLTQACEQMGNAGVHRLLVVDGDRLVGIVTTMDITQSVARSQL